MRAALYARFSSDNQRDASIDDQLRLCSEHAVRAGLTVVDQFSDYAVSGASLNRPGIQSLLRACQDNKFDVVLMEALDRLSRDQEDVAALFKRFNFADIRLITVSEGEINELHVGLKGTMNSLYLKDLADKTRRGLRGRVEAGKSGGGKSYGYDVVAKQAPDGTPLHGERAVNSDEARIVVRIFEEYAKGKSPRAIAKGLNAQQIPGPNSKAWGPSTINGNIARGTGILNNELYIGRLVWNKLRYLKDPETGKRVSRLNPKDTWIVKEVPDLRIVGDDIWQKVKDRQSSVKKSRTGKANKPFWDRRRPRYLFSGLMKCGCCGGGYSKINAHLFGCSTARNKGTCDNRLNIRRDVLEETVLHGLNHHLMDPVLFEEFCKEFTKELNRLRMNQGAERALKARELEKVERSIRQIIEAIKSGVPPLTIKDEMIALEDRKAALTQELAAAPEEQPFLLPSMATLYRNKVTELKNALNTEGTKDEAFDLIRSLVDEILLVPDNGELAIEIKGDLAGILSLCSQSKSPSGLKPEGLEQVKLVAGIGFEPMTFRL